MPTGEPEARWWFTSRIPRLEAAVREAIEAEDLRRSLIMPPEVFGPRPTTDGSEFYVCGVPIVNYLTAPFYLFDSMDTLDKIHRPSLVPVTRAAVRIIKSTSRSHRRHHAGRIRRCEVKEQGTHAGGAGAPASRLQPPTCNRQPYSR